VKYTYKQILLITAAICSFQISNAQEISRAHYVSAKEYLRKDSLNLALIELDSATKISPNFAIAYDLKGDICKLKNEDRRAIGQYSLAILHDPKLADVYIKRAALHYKLKDHRNYLLNDINDAIALKPNDFNLYRLKAFYYAHTLSPKTLKPDLENAIIALNMAIMLAPDSSELYKTRSEYKFKNGNRLSALLDINTAIQKDESIDSYFHLRGVIRFTMGDFRSSLNDINKAIELDSLNYLYYQLRGNIYYNLSKYNQAYFDYSSSVNMIFQEITKTTSKMTPNNPLNLNLRETLLLRGMSLVQENKPFDGCDDFKRALQMGESKATNYIRQYCQ
jgi:tetratricopeptide (TPR) repeat protein